MGDDILMGVRDAAGFSYVPRTIRICRQSLARGPLYLFSDENTARQALLRWLVHFGSQFPILSTEFID